VTVWLQLVQGVQSAAAAASSVVTVTMPTFYTLPAVQQVPRATPVSQTAIRPAETITTLSQSRVMTLPQIMPAKAVTSVVPSPTAVAPPTPVTSPPAMTAVTPSTSSGAVGLSPTAGNKRMLRVIIPNTRSATTSEDVRRHCALLLEQ